MINLAVPRVCVAPGSSPAYAPLDELRWGRLLFVLDAVNRDDEGDLVFAAALATPEVPSFVVRHTSGFARGRVRADAAGPDDGPGRRRAGSADGVWKIAHRIVTDDWSMWADCTEKVARLGTHTGPASEHYPSYTVWDQGLIAKKQREPIDEAINSRALARDRGVMGEARNCVADLLVIARTALTETAEQAASRVRS
jgi:3,4-dihydroxy-2-butanone 4-phosphate synthase